MSTTTTSSHRDGDAGRWAGIATLVVIAGFAVFFYAEYALRYFAWSQEAYGDYYWGKRIALALHLVGGTLALFAGLAQLWTGLRKRYMRVHRWTGRSYLIGVAIGSAGSFLMSTSEQQILGFGFAFALFALGVAWIVTTGAAYYAIRKRRIQLHKEWMIRSYIVTLAFVTFRLLSDWVPYQAWGLDVADYNTAMMWSCWVFPLLAAEVVFQFRKA